MRVNIINIMGPNASFFHRNFHCASRAPAFRIHIGQAIRVRRGAVAHDFSMDRRLALPRVLQLFQDQHPRALADHEPVPFFIERPRGFFRLVITSRKRGQ